MIKFGLFLIFTLITFENSYEALSKKIGWVEISAEMLALQFQFNNLKLNIKTDIMHYETHSLEIELATIRHDITQKYDELKIKINNVDQTEIKNNTVAVICKNKALDTSLDAWNKHQNITSECVSKAESPDEENNKYLNQTWIKVDNLQTEIHGKTDICFNDQNKDDPVSDAVLQCLHDALQQRSELVLIQDEFKEKSLLMRQAANYSLGNLTECLTELEDFNKISDEIIDTLQTCTATNIFSQNIIFVCLCLFGLLQMM